MDKKNSEKIYFRKSDILAYLKYVYENEKEYENYITCLDNEFKELTIQIKIKDMKKFIQYMKDTKRHRKNKKRVDRI